jgi:hypothetical protein
MEEVRMESIWEKLAKQPVIHDKERKRRAIAFIEARQGTCTHEEVAEKYYLDKMVIKQGDPGRLTKYGYYAGDHLVMTRWDD